MRLDISRTTGDGYALRLRFEASLVGPCMRCLEAAAPTFTVDAREASLPAEARAVSGPAHPRWRDRNLRGGRAKQEDDASDELTSPYVQDGVLDVRAWARDALALSVPANILCRSDCAGLCPVCGVNLNDAGSDHHHESAPDPRWAALSELRFHSHRAGAAGASNPQSHGLHCPPWPSPSRSSPTRGPRSVVRSIRSKRRRTTRVPIATALAFPTASAPSAGTTRDAR